MSCITSYLSAFALGIPSSRLYILILRPTCKKYRIRRDQHRHWVVQIQKEIQVQIYRHRMASPFARQCHNNNGDTALNESGDSVMEGGAWRTSDMSLSALPLLTDLTEDAKTESDGEISVLATPETIDDVDIVGLGSVRQACGVRPSSNGTGVDPANDSRLRSEPGVGAQGRTNGEAS